MATYPYASLKQGWLKANATHDIGEMVRYKSGSFAGLAYGLIAPPEHDVEGRQICTHWQVVKAVATGAWEKKNISAMRIIYSSIQGGKSRCPVTLPNRCEAE
ncbi:hypothetical protein DAPPUDRAFT_251106 [Daphnia pulex]|uniref:Uncharacterized protein n=1 Tax=Daphnia pulex TaxID=6669 RepID=E9GZR9_DAPPU|nr:hypothetical protein DAPPUDRAFT_251106 [Daphnia pulex]|eukprot:EFX75043.1 hypothetical protein DAPPUDRAFT_251106 [Daphnia pulex]